MVHRFAPTIVCVTLQQTQCKKAVQQIAYVTDHSNYQSLELYLAQPSGEDYEQFNDKMFNYVNNIAPEATANQENNDKPKLKPTAIVSKPAKIDDSVQVEIQQYQEENQ